MEPSQPRQNTIWAVVDDLFFSSRIRATAAALGKDLILFESPAGLQGRSPDGVSMLILDLNARTFDALAFLRDAKCDPRLSQVPTNRILLPCRQGDQIGGGENRHRPVADEIGVHETAARPPGRKPGEGAMTAPG
jgi:hypothetical protein